MGGVRQKKKNGKKKKSRKKTMKTTYQMNEDDLPNEWCFGFFV